MRGSTIRRSLLCLGGLPLLFTGVLVAHDVYLNRRECSPFVARFKAEEILTTLPLGWDRVCPTVAGVADESVASIGDGRFDVRFHVNGRREGEWSTPIPFRCTMRCGGLDDWALEEYQLDGNPIVRCDIPLSPGGLANRLWFGRVVRALGVE